MIPEDIVIFLTDASARGDGWRVEGILCNPLATDRLHPLRWTAWELLKGRDPARCLCRVARFCALGTGLNAEGQFVSFADDEEIPLFNAQIAVREQVSNAVILDVETDNPLFLVGDFLTSAPAHTPTQYKVAVDVLLHSLDQSPDFQRNIAYSERVALRNDDGTLIPDHPVIEMKTAARQMKPEVGQLLPVELPADDKTILGVLRLDRAVSLTGYEATLFLVDGVKELAVGSILVRSTMEVKPKRLGLLRRAARILRLLRSTTEAKPNRSEAGTIEIAKITAVLDQVLPIDASGVSPAP
ncbi:MAG TPA: hypothetical protein VEL76_37930 [Gemmataceae bacterium]|nr:hypothetical protein [Gemmataceae bacterium]